LLRPRDEDPRDSGRRDTVMDAYRAGETTHAARSSDERITISNAVQ
jgi:type IV pilus biogenesis protein CpaD/CtpE